ncbi:aldehyde dehydrogenase family protein [Aureimonas fodinaquatilis]|uniref:Aldehyde dehydrogenase family protein n=1 Tax=Aureimonas fodinaquatilis TaxID=2565783 RepID=A0A5B0DSX1_9HYPH|nr:aldehyde dehydrogenase family protein [Aureimonas fodinaquatilis]KAA0969493.1 aldehyde dehydrogenase family protein [Aureimonas fodinaquatilis]
MVRTDQFYIDGQWVAAETSETFPVVNPATEKTVAQLSMGTAEHVDRAVAAARKAFPEFSRTTREERLALLERIIAVYESRAEELAHLVMIEMGSPLWFGREVQVQTALNHFKQAHKVLQDYDFGHMMSGTRIVREPVGVCGFITPWNWPINQVAAKFASAFAAGCTVVVKPSEIAPLSPLLLAEIIHEAGVPAGVFNLINGDGPTVGDAISRHPDIDMVSFTGSTRAGVLVAKAAADTVKRVHQELGGKSANILLPGTDLQKTVPASVLRSFTNSGQSCQAPTRLLVHRSEAGKVYEIAHATAQSVTVGDPEASDSRLGPLASELQFERVQAMIQTGLDEGARLLAGGPGRPEHLATGWYARPSIFVDVQPQMTIAQQEIFGPVLSILVYDTVDEAVKIANDSVYGLAGYVSAPSLDEAKAVGMRLRAGRIYLNGAPHSGAQDVEAPFGGYKQSGNGREAGLYGLEDFLEIKAMIGYAA